MRKFTEYFTETLNIEKHKWQIKELPKIRYPAEQSSEVQRNVTTFLVQKIQSNFFVLREFIENVRHFRGAQKPKFLTFRSATSNSECTKIKDFWHQKIHKFFWLQLACL